MKRTLTSAALLALAWLTPGLASAQQVQLQNGSFEDYDTFFNLPLGWKDFTNPGERYRRVGDGLGPILTRTGDASIELASGNNFAGFTSDEFSDCLGRRNNPKIVFTDIGGHLDGPPVVVTGWYAIPANQPLTGANSCIKLEFRRPNNSISQAFENLVINGHTNGQWVKFTVTVTAADLDATYQNFPPAPVTVSVLPIRFGSFSSSGTIFWDDIEFRQGCPADFNKDGFVDGIDYDTFNNLFEQGDPAADYNLDCFVDGIDYDQFNNDFETPCP